jgi:hypothetical protein
MRTAMLLAVLSMAVSGCEFSAEAKCKRAVSQYKLARFDARNSYSAMTGKEFDKFLEMAAEREQLQDPKCDEMRALAQEVLDSRSH